MAALVTATAKTDMFRDRMETGLLSRVNGEIMHINLEKYKAVCL